MSAPITILQAQSCLRSALADEVAAIGGIGIAHVEVGVSEDTLIRWIKGTAGDWNAGAIGALVAAAYRQRGTSLVCQRMRQLLDSAIPSGDARRAQIDVATTLPGLLAEAHQMAEAVAAGPIDRAHARRIAAHLPELQRHLERMQVDIAALLRSEAP